MNTNDFNRPLNSDSLNESLQKTFNVQINFDKYTREQLENYRNLIRTKVHQVESTANFNDLLSNDVYQKDKFVLNVLNTRIKEMLGEGKEVVAEKAKSKAQQKFMGMVHAAHKGEKPASKEVAKVAKGMSKKAAKDYAATKHKGLPAHKSDESVEEGTKMKTTKKAKPDFLDMDKDGNKKEPMKKAVKDKKIDEVSSDLANRYLDKAQSSRKNDKAHAAMSMKQRDNRMQGSNTAREKVRAGKGLDSMARVGTVGEGKNSKPDYIDLDKDGNKKETMKKAAKDKKKVKEGIHDLRHRAYQNFIAEGLAHYLAEDEEGKAKAITAGADMVNDFTSWMQRVGNYQTKSMIELADNIRANFGVQQAETFKASVGQALEGALNSLTTAREEINNAVAVLAGEAPAEEPMGQEPGMGEPAMGGDVRDLDAASPDAMNLPSMDDEFAASDAAAGGMDTTGRMKRESIERGNRLMKILGS